MDAYSENLDEESAVEPAEIAQPADTPVAESAPAAEALAKKRPSDLFRLSAEISIFHYRRLKILASDRGLPVDQLLEELIDRTWTYRGK